MRGYYPGHQMPFWHFPSIIGILLFIGIIVAVVFAVRALLNRPKQNTNTINQSFPNPPVQTHPTESAIRILNERYAKGEIDDLEYKTKKDAILGQSSEQG